MYQVLTAVAHVRFYPGPFTQCHASLPPAFPVTLPQLPLSKESRNAKRQLQQQSMRHLTNLMLAIQMSLPLDNSKEVRYLEGCNTKMTTSACLILWSEI